MIEAQNCTPSAHQPTSTLTVQNSPDIISDWMVSQSIEYEFSIKYPTELYINVENNTEIHWSGIGKPNLPWVLSIVIKNNPEMEERSDFPYTLFEWEVNDR